MSEPQARDFRYTMPDGSTVEAFQVTPASRYQERDWPEWMTSRMWMTAERPSGGKKHYLMIGEAETEIPEYGWIINRGGTIGVVGYEEMEQATKVVPVKVEIPPLAEPMSDQQLHLAAKITGRSIDDCRAEDLANVEEANRNRQDIIDAQRGYADIDIDHAMPDEDDYQVIIDAEAGTVRFKDSPPDGHVIDLPTGRTTIGMPQNFSDFEPVRMPDVKVVLIEEMREIYRLFIEGEQDTAVGKLQRSLAARTDWCNCPPGMCDGERDQWECRQNSLLAR